MVVGKPEGPLVGDRLEGPLVAVHSPIPVELSNGDEPGDCVVIDVDESRRQLSEEDPMELITLDSAHCPFLTTNISTNILKRSVHAHASDAVTFKAKNSLSPFVCIVFRGESERLT